jgi:hypothetical protein
VARFAQLVAAGRRPAVLPDDRAVERLSRPRVPRDDGLALVRDPDPGEIRSRNPGVVERLPRHAAGDRPDLLRVVLHPAGPREVLIELAVRAADRPPALVEHDAGRARGPLVDGEDHRREA